MAPTTTNTIIGTRKAASGGSQMLPAPPFERTRRVKPSIRSRPTTAPVGDEPHGLRRDQLHDVAGAGADGDADCKLARASRDGERQYAIDTRRRQQDADDDQRDERRGGDHHLLAHDADDLIDGLGSRHRRSRPGLAYVLAQSLDERRWISLGANEKCQSRYVRGVQSDRHENLRLGLVGADRIVA